MRVMRFRGDEGIMVIRTLILCFCILATSVNALPQENNSAPRKLDEFGDLPADDAMAHLDVFAVALSENPNSRGYIIGYNEPRILPGHFLRRVYGYWDYLQAVWLC